MSVGNLLFHKRFLLLTHCSLIIINMFYNIEAGKHKSK
jgi:hypothetical protein